MAVLLALAIVSAQGLYGGLLRTVFALPAYGFLAIAGALTVVVILWRRAVSPNGWAVLSVVLAGSYLLWRSLESPGQDLSVFYTFLVTGCLVAYLVSACMLTTPAARYVFVSILFAAIIAQATVAAMQFTADKDFFPLPWVSEQMRQWNLRPVAGGVRRGMGFFLSGNQLAWFFNIMAFFGLGIAAFGRCSLWAKIVLAYLGGVCVVGTMMTLSRGGVIGLGFGLVVFLLLVVSGIAVGARDRRFLFVAGAIAASAIFIGGAYLLFANSAIVKARLDLIVDDSYRLNLWRAVLSQIQLEPVMGTGAGSFTQISRRLTDSSNVSNNMYAHNDWAQMISDFGFVGFGLLALAAFVNLKVGVTGFLKALRERMAISSRPQSNSAAFLAGSISACAAAAAHSFFDYNMQIPANAILVSVCLGMLANSGIPSLHRSWRGSFVRVATALCAVGASAWLLFLLQRHSVTEWHSLLAENELLQGRAPVAEAIATRALEEAPDHSRLRRIRGESLLRSASPETTIGQVALGKASGDFQRAIALDPEERWNHLLMGMTLVRLEDIRRAEQFHIEAVRLDPSSPVMHEYYGLSLEQYGRTDDAIRIYESAALVPGTKFARQRMDALKRLKQP
jgi:O-antigen ligase